MFTGLVRERGRLTADPTPSADGGVVLAIGHGASLGAGLEIGASLAVSGVCLTIVTLASADDGGMMSTVELSPETLRRTTLGALRAGDEVNLEPALRMGDPLGGHWVQGHVDTTLEILAIDEFGGHWELTVGLPAEQAPFVVEKGSVTLDGVSLTVATLEHDRFTIALIPHTLEVTTLGQRQVGDRLHYEADVLAKYVQRAVAPHLPRDGTASPGAGPRAGDPGGPDRS